MASVTQQREDALDLVYPFLAMCAALCAMCVVSVMWSDWRRERLLRRVLERVMDTYACEPEVAIEGGGESD